jgi:hypothetical protein
MPPADRVVASRVKVSPQGFIEKVWRAALGAAGRAGSEVTRVPGPLGVPISGSIAWVTLLATGWGTVPLAGEAQVLGGSNFAVARLAAVGVLPGLHVGGPVVATDGDGELS